MKTLLLKLFLLLTFVVLSSADTFAQNQVNLDSAIIAYKNSHSIPGIATIIVKNDEVIFSKNYGYRNLQLQLPVEDSTLFRIASISKTIMVTAVMQLWENGLLELENNINSYLPSGFTVVNPNHLNDSINVKMLMNHTSSLKDNWNLAPVLLFCGDSPISLDSLLINYFTPGGVYYYDTLNFYTYKPGQDYNYSNVAACLLAMIVENLSGKSFDNYCRDSIFIPLSMNSTSWSLEGLDTNNIAIPYLIGGTPVCHQGSPIWPAGYLRTNKLDLMNFLKMYMNNGVYNGINILDSSTIAYMLSDHLGYYVVNNTIEQGLIWFRFLPFNDNIWGHDGASTGCATYMGYNPEENYGFVWFQNYIDNYARVGLFEILSQLNEYAIPVELTSFTATLNGNEVILNWSTATELNNSGFNIERKSGTGEYSEIGFVPGYGTTTEPKSYTYTDSKVSTGRYSYRLKQIDFDGSYEYLPEVEVEVGIPLYYALEQSYPNPFNPRTTISWQSPVGSHQTLKIYDVLGNEITTLVNEYKPAGRYEIEFNAAALPNGVYLYQIKAGEFVNTKKMILLK